MNASVLKSRSAITIIATLLSSVASTSVFAQTQVAGQRTASVTMATRLVVGYRLHVRQRTPIRIVSQDAGVTEVEFDLEAASNVSWQLALTAPLAQDSVAFGRTEVRDAHGVWRKLERNSPAVVVVGDRPPCNPTPVTVRMRVYDNAAATVYTAPRFMMGVSGQGF